MKKVLLRLLPWAVALGVLALLFAKTDFRAVGRAVSNARPWAAPVLVVFLLLNFLADVTATWKTFSWFAAPIGFRETLIVRGASYPLALVSYALGQSAFVYFLHRTRGVSLARCTATVLLVMGINLLALLLLVTGGLLAGEGKALPPALHTVVWAAYAGLAVYAVVVALRPGWLARRPLFDVLLSAGLAGHVKALAVRMPHVLVLIAMQFLNLRAFGIDVSFVQSVLLMPAVMFVAVLPISVQGLGTSQAMMVLLFARFAPAGVAHPESLVLAAGLSAQVLATVVQLIVGLVCLRTPLGRSLLRRAPEPAPT